LIWLHRTLSHIERFVRAVCICNFLCITTFSLMQLSTLHCTADNLLNHLVRCELFDPLPVSSRLWEWKCLHGISRNCSPFIIMIESLNLIWQNSNLRTLSRKIFNVKYDEANRLWHFFRNFPRVKISILSLLEKFTVKIKVG